MNKLVTLEYDVAQMHEASAERTFPRQFRVQDRYTVGPMHHQRYVGIGYDPLRPPHTIPHDCTFDTPSNRRFDTMPYLVLGGAGCLGAPQYTSRSYPECSAHKASPLGLMVSQQHKSIPTHGSVYHWRMVHGRSSTAISPSRFS